MDTISRKNLYDAVWSRPMVKVAAEFGISDVGLKKICAKHRIPVPGRGYWAKKAAGQPVSQVSLRITKDEALETVRIFGGVDAKLAEPVRRARAAAHEKEAEPERKVTVSADTPAVPPPLLARTIRVLEKAKPDREGFISVNGAGLVSMRISPLLTKRAITIATALIQAAEQRGYQPACAAGGLSLAIQGESLEMSIQERPEQVSHEPTAEELKEKQRREKSGYTWYRGDPWKKYDYRPSGRLGIKVVTESYSGIRLRSSWGDRGNKRFEDSLNDVFVGLVAYSAAKKLKRLEREEREREWREAEERRQRAARRKALNAEREKAS